MKKRSPQAYKKFEGERGPLRTYRSCLVPEDTALEVAIDPFHILDPKPDFNTFLSSTLFQTFKIESVRIILIYFEEIPSSSVPRPASETVERNDSDVRRSDRDSDPIIRRVPLCLFLPPNTTFAHSPSPPQVPDTPPPFPLLPFTSKSRVCHVPHQDRRI